jgi:hypothetical protein
MTLTVLSQFNCVVCYYEESNSHYSTNKLLLSVSYDFLYMWTNSVNIISISGPSPINQERILESQWLNSFTASQVSEQIHMDNKALQVT